jgi:two-component system response regulator NreC
MGRINDRRVPVEDGREVWEILNAREIEIATLVAQGRTNREIGAVLSLADRTIGGYTRDLYEKLGLKSRIQLVRWAWKKGLVKISDFPAVGPSSPNKAS